MENLYNETALARLMSKTRIAETGCWEFTGARNSAGYGNLWSGRRLVCAHRAAYELWVEAVPAGMELHHTCKNTCCCNPAHLQIVHPKGHRKVENSTKTHCRYGHEYTPENTYRIHGTGARSCKKCRLAATRRSKEKKRGCPIPLAYAKRTHCPKGHPYDEANTYVHRGHRYCRACHNEMRRKKET